MNEPSTTEPARDGELHVALLRGINVGGKNKLPMKELVAIFEAAGCRDVRTYIQSGNVLFRVPDRRLPRLREAIPAAIAERLGLRVPVVLRTEAELRAALTASPFLARGEPVERLHVAFLADTPSAAQRASLDPARSPGDEYEVLGRDVHLCLPNGVGRSKITNAYLDSKLGTVSTLRKLQTVRALVAMLDD